METFLISRFAEMKNHTSTPQLGNKNLHNYLIWLYI